MAKCAGDPAPAHPLMTEMPVSNLVFAKITMTEEVMLRSLRMRHGGFIRWSVHFKSIIFYLFTFSHVKLSLSNSCRYLNFPLFVRINT